MNARIFHALRSALLSVCLFIAALMSTAVHGQEVTLYVHGDLGYAIQEFRCCGEPCNTCDVYPECTGDICPDLICSSWEYPCKYLQDALARASELLSQPEPPETVHIWVAATAENNPYRPHMCSEWHSAISMEPKINTCAWGSQGCTGWSFHLQNNVEIYGGFAGWETVLSQRNWENNITVLSGDFEGNSTFTLYCDDGRVYRNGELVLQFTNYDDNSYAVVRAMRNINETATIDGFTIRTTNGSAFIAIDARPWVFNCIFISSTSAAVHLIGESFIVFDRCRFQSPVREPILADESATVHCVGE